MRWRTRRAVEPQSSRGLRSRRRVYRREQLVRSVAARARGGDSRAQYLPARSAGAVRLRRGPVPLVQSGAELARRRHQVTSLAAAEAAAARWRQAVALIDLV